MNGDGVIDLTDATLIFAARGSAASGPDDPRNPSGNNMITGQDVRICGLQIPPPLSNPNSQASALIRGHKQR
ncbi:MAG: hypothetical protein P8X46_12600 [Nitrospirales bacterium]